LSISDPTNEYGLINVNNLKDINKSFRLISNNEDLQMPDKALLIEKFFILEKYDIIRLIKGILLCQMIY